MKNEQLIESLTADLHFLLEEIHNDPNFSVGELEKIRDSLEILLKQGSFWIKQENNQRFIYDLEGFNFFLIEEIEKKDRKSS